jgi:CBS domain-containing protein
MGNHRILVREEDKVAMITQSDVIRFLLFNEPERFKKQAQEAAERAMKSRGPSCLNTDPNQPVNVKKHVLTISKDMHVISAFKMMNMHKISTLGITNSVNELVGVISATDLLKLDWNRLEDLLLPLQDYISSDVVVTTLKTETLDKITEKALSEKIHGVFIVDSYNHPTGVIRFSDILASVI